jgi:hypothetical protein
MNKQGILFFSFFITALLAPHLILHFKNSPGQITVLAFVPIVFSLLYIMKCITLLIDKRYKDAGLCFFISILFFCITLKVEYSIYNIFAVSLLCTGSILYLFKKGLKERRQTILALITALNILLVLVPDKLLYGHIWNQRTWSEDFSWEAFRNAPKAGSEFDAETSSSICYKVNYAYNYPPALVIALMDEDSSWVRSPNENLLLHEKGHLDMNEIYSRKAQDSIKTAYFQPPEKIAQIINYFIDESLRQQDLYDSETDHSADHEQQKIWTDKLNVLLKKQ